MKKNFRTARRPQKPDRCNVINECQRCRNEYLLVRIAVGDNFQDFGDRFCPYCGLHTDETTGSVLGLYPAAH